MKCPKCQMENPEAKKFCTECGAKLSLVCPSCQSEVLPTEKFCGECGLIRDSCYQGRENQFGILSDNELNCCLRTEPYCGSLVSKYL
jgi:hypothetical protein